MFKQILTFSAIVGIALASKFRKFTYIDIVFTSAWSAFD